MDTQRNGCKITLWFLVTIGGLILSISNERLSAASCANPPSGLVSWWPADGNALDIQGTNNGTFTNPSYGTGEVGQAFSFDGSGNNVRVPAATQMDVGSGPGMTIEAWIYSTKNTSPAPIVEWVPKTVGAFGAHFYAHQGGPGVLYANLYDTAGNSHMIQTATGLISTNSYQHVALTYDKTSGLARLFVNGTLATESPLGRFIPQTGPDLSIGYRPNTVPFGPISFLGQIDEVSLYSRALETNELQAIYAAGSAGKCFSVAPSIETQPTNLSLFVGANATFNVLAAGSRPLLYQWTMDGTNLLGATNALLTLTNVQPAQSGSYAVEVTNAYGSTLSSNALLIINLPPPCANPPAGLVSWWPAEGNAFDNEGANNGFFTNPSYSPGEVGQAFTFDGSGNNVRVPASFSMDVGAGNGMTVEAWIFSTDNSTGRPIVEWVPKTVGAFGTHFYVHTGGPGALYANLYDTANNSHIIQTASGIVPLNTYEHVAVTYDKASGIARLFLNGAQVAQTILGTFTPQTSPDLSIGYRPNTVPFGPIPFFGQIDEVSLYSRALSASEIQIIYNAGMSGKCNVPIGPTVFVQPTAQTLTIGQTASFQVQAGGTHPLGYQWAFNSQNIPGATDASLVLTNVQMSQAGNYSVVVTNAYGSALSSNAALVVNFPPASVNVVNSSGAAGQVVTVPVALVANGNENAVGFSLNYSAASLSCVGVNLGTAATGAALQFNTNQAGAVGVAVALSSGATFAPGTQEVAEVSFLTAVSALPYSVPLSFGDQPTKRELSDATANLLAADFTGGQVSLSRSTFEADVSPRPDGDGSVTIVDWVQVGRYVAALDSPTNGSEFQRADCAPRSTLGDGLLTVSDWVQAGRYAAGLDPLTLAGGPTVPSGPGIVRPAHKLGADPLRTIIIQGALILPGQTTGSAQILLDAQGDENAIGLSLSFDPKVVSFTSATNGADATGATMDVNANQATNGQLGIILALPTDTSFSPGTRQVLKINFQALTTNSVNSPVALTDLPVRREVADTNALPVVATYANGTISINPKPSLAITNLTQTVNLAWPFWATNYLLQQAVSGSLTTWTNSTLSPVLTNNALNVTVPLSGSVQFYRLQHQ